MKQQHTLQPKLRFPEFEEDWHNERLENLATRGSGHTPNKQIDRYYDGDIKWISLADSKQLDQGFIKKTEISISTDGIKNSSAVLHKKGTVLLSRDAGIGKSAVMYEDMAVSQHFITWTCDDVLLNNWFLYYKLQILKPEFERIAVGTTIKTIGLPYFKKLSFSTPKINEQQKIADYLSTIDTKINLLEEKKAQLALYKKTMMQKLFSQEIRFKDDNGNDFPEWEEKRLGELFIYKNGKSFENSLDENGDYFLISLNSIDINGELKKKHKRLSYSDNSLSKGDLVMVLSDVAHGNFLGLSAIIPNDNFVLNQRMAALKPITKDNIVLVRYFINYNQKYFKLKGQGSSQLNLSKGDVENFEVKIPSLPEQQKIAEFLSAIDASIEKVTEQISQMQSFKKAMLQQMFV